MVDGGRDQQPKSVDLGKVEVKIAAPPRQDGYKPITDAPWTWAALAGDPGLEPWRLISAAARRLDFAHRQIERLRDALDGKNPPGPGNPTARQKLHELVADVEAAVWSLDMAITIASSLSGRYKISVSFPTIVRQKTALIGSLRDHYSHIDERALGRVWGKSDARAEKAFEFLTLLGDRAITDGNESLGIDTEATELCVALRDYLRDVWQELVHRANEAARAASSDA